MTINERTVGGAVVLSIAGDIIMGGAGETPVSDTVRRALQDGYSHLVLDLGQVRYVDSAGLGELVQAYSAARMRGGALKLIHLTKRMKELLAVTKLLTVFDCYEDESLAVASFQRTTVP